MLYRGIEDPSLSMSVALAGFVIADVSRSSFQNNPIYLEI